MSERNLYGSDGQFVVSIDDDDRMLCHGLFGDSDTLVGPESREAFERHYPGMAQSFPGGHQLNSEVLANTLVPYIRSLNV